MGREEVVHPLAVERIDDEHMRRRRIALGIDIIDMRRIAGDLLERRGEPARLTADLCAAAVGCVFPCAADRHLNQHGGKGATIIATRTPMNPKGLLRSSRPLEKRKAKFDSIEIAPRASP